MSEPSPSWKQRSFALLVTGKGEAAFLDRLFRSLMAGGDCRFCVARKVEQLTPRTSAPKRLAPPGGKALTSRDEETALAARKCLASGFDYVILVDDLESDRRAFAAEVSLRYRTAFDHILEGQKHRASVHFLANMLEAYYWADAKAVNAVLGTDWADHDGDVEAIRHPKNDLKARSPGFDEIEHGRPIVNGLDLRHVLSHPDRCASLRTLIGWCWRALGRAPGDEYRLADGSYFDVTRGQIDLLPDA